MNKLREAAQQALEALEMAEFDPHSSDAVHKAITALRAALADGDKLSLTEPVQEPAGWLEGQFGEFRANQLFKHSWPAQTVAWSIPLYLAPPQRKPLTDELYNELLFAVGSKYPDETRHQTALRYIKRAEMRSASPAKAAHNIKEGT
jgi:hypothetical protein